MVGLISVQRYVAQKYRTIDARISENNTKFAHFLIYPFCLSANGKPLKEYYSMETLDKTDIQILRILQNNSKLTTKEIAAQVSLSTTPVHERLKRLETEGYIKRYVAILDAEKLHRGFVVFCSVKLKRLSHDIVDEFSRIVQNIPEVTECYNISGEYDFMLKIHAPDMKYYQHFILNLLGSIDSVSSLTSTFVMAEIKHNYGISI